MCFSTIKACINKTSTVEDIPVIFPHKTLASHHLFKKATSENKTAVPHIIVCINHNPKSIRLLRMARNWAQDTGGQWTVLYIKTPLHMVSPHYQRRAISRLLSIAERLGAQSIVRHHLSRCRAIIYYVKKQVQERLSSQVHLIVGQDHKNLYFTRVTTSLGTNLIQHELNACCTINLVTLSSPCIQKSFIPRWHHLDFRIGKPMMPLLMILSSILAMAIFEMLFPERIWADIRPYLPLMMIFLPLFIGLKWGVTPALFSTIIYSLGVDACSGFNIYFYSIPAISLSFLGAYTRTIQQALQRKEWHAQNLYKMYSATRNIVKQTQDIVNQAQALEFLRQELNNIFDVNIIFFLPSPEKHTALTPHFQEHSDYSQYECDMAKKSWREGLPMGIWCPEAKRDMWFQPLRTSQENLGVLGYEVPAHMMLDRHFLQLFSAVTDQVSGILERIELNSKMRDSIMCKEREKLRAILLSSVSHDLKTPLVGIIGSLSLYKSLKSTGKLTPVDATDLTNTALEEGERLHSFINNILNMTRIENGAIHFNLAWHDPVDVLKRVKKRLSYTLRHHSLVIIEGTPHLTKIDEVMIAQVLQNVIDNAVKYSPLASQITVLSEIDRQNGGTSYTISDRGPGIPPARLTRVFDKFERLNIQDNKVAGTGLGLAICAQIIAHHKGEIYAKNRIGGGTKIVIWLPDRMPFQAQQHLLKQKNEGLPREEIRAVMA